MEADMDGNTCKCHIVKRWQLDKYSDEQYPIYEKCALHKPDIFTDGYDDTPLADVLGYDPRDFRTEARK